MARHDNGQQNNGDRNLNFFQSNILVFVEERHELLFPILLFCIVVTAVIVFIWRCFRSTAVGSGRALLFIGLGHFAQDKKINQSRLINCTRFTMYVSFLPPQATKLPYTVLRVYLLYSTCYLWNESGTKAAIKIFQYIFLIYLSVEQLQNWRSLSLSFFFVLLLILSGS